MKPTFLLKILCLYLAVATALITLPAQGWAMFVTSPQPALSRQSDLNQIRTSLESSLIKQQLLDYGLSPDETQARLSVLSDAQIHQLAADMDSLQAGADGVDGLIFLLLVAILVVVILQATGHRIIIR